MKINKKSWHYRWLKSSFPDFQGEKPKLPNNLCSYVQILVGWTLVLILISPLFLVITTITDWVEKFSNREKKDPIPREPRTLIGKWLKAKKEKVCPLLEWEEEAK